MPGIGAASYILKALPYSLISPKALFGPIPVNPGTLSPLSPVRHYKEMYSHGATS